LSFALAVEPAHDDKTKRLQRDSAALIGGMAEVRVSAVVVAIARRAFAAST